MTTENTNIAKKLIETKLEILDHSLENRNSWYTGESIKSFLKSTIFSLTEPENTKNQLFYSNNCQAYCHYSSTSAFINMLDRHQVNKYSKVLLHPLLSPDLIDIIISRGSNIIFCDIDTANLSFEKIQFETIIKKEKPNLIIHFNDNGLYIPLQDLLRPSNILNIPSMIIINNQTITQDFMSLINAHVLGSLIWNAGECFQDTVLSEVANKSFKHASWTISWLIGVEIKSPTSEDFNDNVILYEPVVRAYYYDLLLKYREFGIKTIFYDFHHKSARKMRKFDRPQSDKKIQDSFENILLAPIPDIVFDLKNTSTSSDIIINDLLNTQKLSTKLKTSTLSLESILLADIKLAAKDTDLVKTANRNYTYLKYFFYTLDKQFWADWAYKKKLKIYELQPLHDVFVNTNLPNAKMVSEKVVYFDTVDFIL
jgi:hypothetical protein